MYGSTVVGITSATPILYRQTQSPRSLHQHLLDLDRPVFNPPPGVESCRSVGARVIFSAFCCWRRITYKHTTTWVLFRGERLVTLLHSIHNSYPFTLSVFITRNNLICATTCIVGHTGYLRSSRCHSMHAYLQALSD